MLRLAIIACALVGCVQSSEVRCDDGRLCPPGYTCDTVNMRCLSADQISACAGLDEGAECAIAGAPGACRRGTCEPLVCGDGVRSLGEACDGQDLGDATCRDAGFYDEAGLACSDFCTFDVTGCTGKCGDNIVNGFELCDGAPPPGACIDQGFDAGDTKCSIQSCGIAFEECARFGWRPEPTALSEAYAFDATSVNDLWVAGFNGSAQALAHFDGMAWTIEPLVGDATVRVLAVSSANDVWLVRDDGNARTVERRTSGQSMVVTGIPAADYLDIWASGANAVYISTRDAGVLHWNGATWQALGTLAVGGAHIDGTSSNDIWVAGTDGTLHHWNGSAWEARIAPVKVDALDAVAPGEVAVVGESTTSATLYGVGYWDGAQWRSALIPDTFTRLSSVVGRGFNDVLLADVFGGIWHFDGSELAETPSMAVMAGSPLLELRNFGGTTVAFSFDGFVYRFAGHAYARYQVQTTNSMIGSASFTPLQTILFEDRGSTFHYNATGSNWIRKTIDSAFPTQLTFSFAAFAPDDVWVAGAAGRVYRYDGSSWAIQDSLTSSPVKAIVGTPNDLWLLGQSIVHYDGNAFELALVNGSPNIIGASASATNDVWAVSSPLSGGTDVWHWDGNEWAFSHIDPRCTGVVAFAPSNVYAICGARILQWNGAAWSATVTGLVEPLVSISATAPNDIFAVSSREMLHYDGHAWVPVRPPNDPYVAGAALTNVSAYRDRIDLTYSSGLGGTQFRRFVRTRLWNCQASEVTCDDSIDDDCDLLVDTRDSDCP